MSEYHPRVASTWRITGELRNITHPELLNGTMLELYDSSRDILIYAGWEPEEDPNGHYEIGLLRECSLIAGPYHTKDILAAASLVQALAAAYAVETKATEIARAPARPRQYDLEKSNTATTQTNLLCCG